MTYNWLDQKCPCTSTCNDWNTQWTGIVPTCSQRQDALSIPATWNADFGDSLAVSAISSSCWGDLGLAMDSSRFRAKFRFWTCEPSEKIEKLVWPALQPTLYLAFKSFDDLPLSVMEYLGCVSHADYCLFDPGRDVRGASQHIAAVCSASHSWLHPKCLQSWWDPRGQIWTTVYDSSRTKEQLINDVNVHTQFHPSVLKLGPRTILTNIDNCNSKWLCSVSHLRATMTYQDVWGMPWQQNISWRRCFRFIDARMLIYLYV